ncbi:MAG: hypothetical protein OHM77_07995 [Candidatus Nitricoxidivorans perseverans]|uniref:Uncharacterized protein n=1 Tax=Candidatus Nitricoxidivorans perseverans TaxID=2975601 RepID=A0AA49FIH9_9PROT|nr:MAG: hypothetical protein OHM77_07995 [Candidatus Nitricoxidivorans perseverans]
MEAPATEVTAQKVAVKVWRPILDKLEVKMTAACLRRDAYLSRILEVELDCLDKEVAVANSEAARAFVARKFDLLPDKKLVTFVLRSDLVERMSDVCARKRIVRDAFLNRLLLLLAASPKIFDRFLGLGAAWKSQLMKDYRGASFFEDSFYPIEESINPFWAARDWLAEDNESIYRIYWDDTLFKDVDLAGLNCYVEDRWVPGHPDEGAYRKQLDDLDIL